MAKRKPRILISNDDGVYAPGIRYLAKEMKRFGEVVVVAPSSNQSAVSHALTMSRPLRIKRLEDNVYSVDGTPTDCITLAFHEILKKRLPDIVVSGLNHGSNMGEDVIYSGTGAAALEGAIMGLPAVAASNRAFGVHRFARVYAGWPSRDCPYGRLHFHVRGWSAEGGAGNDYV